MTLEIGTFTKKLAMLGGAGLLLGACVTNAGGGAA